MSDRAKRWPPPEVAEAVDDYVATTIPVRVDLEARQTVLHLEEAERVLRASSFVALGPCTCRDEKGGCDAPIDTCLALNDPGARAVEARPGFRSVSVEEALAVLRRSHEAGLVHFAYRKPGEELSALCSCCSCCCFLLTALKRYDYHDAVVEASHFAAHEAARCVGCGTCVTRCPFRAWTPARNGGKPALDAEKCFGCGLCVSTCPTGAVRFLPREPLRIAP